MFGLSRYSALAGTVNPVARLPSKVLDAIGTVVRLGLAAVWLISGAIKAADPNQTYAAVKAYQVLPAGLVSPVAGALPFVELAFGLLVLPPYLVKSEQEGLRQHLTAPALLVSQDLYISDTLKTGRIMAKDEDLCLHCGLCAERCPTGAWDMQKFLLNAPKTEYACHR